MQAFSIDHAERRPLDETISPGWFAVSHLWIPDKRARRRETGRWFRIQSDRSKIYRVLRFRPGLKSNTEQGTGQILLDYDGWNQLTGFSEEVVPELRLVFRTAKRREFLGCISSHPDPSYRLAGWLGVISVVLGVIGLGLGMISLFK
jgi:hypothetical protein